MQISELYRRGIVVPLDHEAAEALLNNHVDLTTRVQCFEFSSEDLFYRIWSKGLFAMINAELGSIIDDYEAEIVGHSDIPKLVEIVKKFRRNTRLESAEENVITELERLFEIAIERSSPIFFIL